jgi:hypothetical protein
VLAARYETAKLLYDVIAAMCSLPDGALAPLPDELGKRICAWLDAGAG